MCLHLLCTRRFNAMGSWTTASIGTLGERERRRGLGGGCRRTEREKGGEQAHETPCVAPPRGWRAVAPRAQEGKGPGSAPSGLLAALREQRPFRGLVPLSTGLPRPASGRKEQTGVAFIRVGAEKTAPPPNYGARKASRDLSGTRPACFFPGEGSRGKSVTNRRLVG